MAVADAAGLPAAACLASASPHEVKLIETALDSLFIAEKPATLIDGKAYDSDKLDNDLLKKQGVEMTAPHRRNRTKQKTQDGRKLRRHQRRWKVGRLFAWLQNFRRLVVRYERHADNFLVFSLLACSIILLRFIEIGPYNAWKPDVKEQIEMQTLNSGGARDISEALDICKNTVISELRKKSAEVNPYFIAHPSHLSHCELGIEIHADAETDEFLSYVGNKKNQRWT